MKRHQQILLGVLVVQVLLSLVSFWPRSSVAGGGKPVLPKLDVEDVVTITIMDDQRKSVTLHKVDGAWGLPDAEQYPVKSEEVTGLLEKLAALDTGNLVARTETSHRQLQVAGDTYMRRVDLILKDETKYTIYFGSAPRYTATHFRVAGQVETYLTTEVSTWALNTSVTSWIDTLYTDIDSQALTEVMLENAHGTFTFVKAGEEWTMVGLAADETLVQGKAVDIVSNASRISMARPLGTTEKPEYGMQAPLAKVTLKSPDATHTVWVGAKDPSDNTYVVKSTADDYYVAVAEYGVRSLVNNTREDFLQPPAGEGDSDTAP